MSVMKRARFPVPVTGIDQPLPRPSGLSNRKGPGFLSGQGLSNQQHCSKLHLGGFLPLQQQLYSNNGKHLFLK